MTQAVVQATFSGMKIIQGRKMLQLHLEIPVENADVALAALGGLPLSDNPKWCAIVRLTPPEAQGD